MPAISIRRQSFLAKREATYGTDSVPVAATDGVLLANDTIPEYRFVQETVERPGIRAFFGNKGRISTKRYATVSLEQELAGFGTAGPASPPAGYDALLRACGLSRTISAGVSVTYAPVSTALDSATLAWNVDGLAHKVPGARGNLKLSMANNQIPLIMYDMMGLYVDVADGAFTAPTVTAYQKPLAIGPDSVTTFVLHGYGSACLAEFEFDSGLELTHRNLVNCDEYIHPRDRKSTGRVRIEATSVAAKDWFTAVKNNATATFSIIHGTTAGNIIEFTSGAVELSNLAHESEDEILMLSMDLDFIPVNASGGDDWSLIIR